MASGKLAQPRRIGLARQAIDRLASVDTHGNRVLSAHGSIAALLRF